MRYLVGAAEKIGLGHAVVAQRNLGEVLDQAREHGVAVPGVARLLRIRRCSRCRRGDGLRARCLPAPPAPQHADVQRLPDVRGSLQDGAPSRLVRHEELVARSGSVHADILGHALRDELLRLGPRTGPYQTLQEEQAEDVGLVVAAVDSDPRRMSAADHRYCSIWATLRMSGGSLGGVATGRTLRLARHRRHGFGPASLRRRCAGDVEVRRRGGWPDEARSQVRLPPAWSSLEAERPAQLLEAIARQPELHLVHTDGSGIGTGHRRVVSWRSRSSTESP